MSLIWGITNPFIKRGSAPLKAQRETPSYEKSTHLRKILLDLWLLLKTPTYVIPVAGNLVGSAIFYKSLGHSKISMVGPIANSLTMVIGTIAGTLLGEPIPTKGIILIFTNSIEQTLGIVLILLGAAVCSLH